MFVVRRIGGILSFAQWDGKIMKLELEGCVMKVAVNLLWPRAPHQHRTEVKLPVCFSSEALSFVYLKFELVRTALFCELQKCGGRLYWWLVCQVKWLSGKIRGGARGVVPQ